MFNESILQINHCYQYEDNDIQAILIARLKQISFSKPIHVLAAVDNIVQNQLSQRLIEEKQTNVGERILLIPCNIGNAHWVGILIEIDSNNQPKRNEYIDSLSSSNHDIPATFEQQVTAVYPNFGLQCSFLLKQDDLASCGVYTIENLLLSAQNQVVAQQKKSSDLRQLHLESLKKSDPEFYDAFYIRQRYNQSSVVPISQQLYYHQSSSHIPFSAEQIQRIQHISNCINNISDQTIKAKLLQVFNFKEKYQNNPGLHLEAIRKQLQKATARLSKKQDKKNFKTLFQLLFNVEWENDDPSIIKNPLSFQIDYNEILAITQAHDPCWEIEQLLTIADLLIKKQLSNERQDKKEIKKQFKKINRKISKLEDKNEEKYNYYKYLHHSSLTSYYKAINEIKESLDHEILSKTYKSSLKEQYIIFEERNILDPNASKEVSTLKPISLKEKSILDAREKIFTILESLIEDQVLNQLKHFFDQINTSNPQNFTDYCQLNFYEIEFNNLINEMIVKLSNITPKESNDENIKNIIVALTDLKTDFNKKIYGIRINFMKGILSSPNRELILFDTLLFTEEDIYKHCRKLLFCFHPDKTPWLQGDDKSIGNELCFLIGEYKEKFLQKLKEKSVSVDQFTFYQKNGEHYQAMMMDYKFAQKGEWEELKLLKKEDVSYLNVEELDRFRLNCAALAYREYRACCKIADKNRNLKEQVFFRKEIALCLFESNQNLESLVYVLSAIQIIMQFTEDFTQEELNQIIVIYYKIYEKNTKNSNLKSQISLMFSKFPEIKINQDQKPCSLTIAQTYSYVHQKSIENFITKILNNVLGKLLFRNKHDFVESENFQEETLRTKQKEIYRSIQGDTAITAPIVRESYIIERVINITSVSSLIHTEVAKIAGSSTAMILNATTIGLGIWNGITLWKKENTLLKESKIREKLNVILQKALQYYDAEDHTGFITALSEEYEQGISILALKPGTVVNPEEIIKCLLSYDFRPDGVAYLLNLIGEILSQGKINVPGLNSADLISKAKDAFYGTLNPILEQAANELDKRIYELRKKNGESYALKFINSAAQEDFTSIAKDHIAKKHFTEENFHNHDEMLFTHRLEEIRNIAKINIAVIDLIRVGHRLFNRESNELNAVKMLIDEVRYSVNSHDQFISHENIRLETVEDFFWIISGQSFDDQDLSTHNSISWKEDQKIQNTNRYLTYLDASLEKASSSEEKIKWYNTKALYYFNKADQEEKIDPLHCLCARQKAQEYYLEALKLNPQEPNAILGLAKCLLKLSKYTQVIQFLTKTNFSTAEHWVIAGIAHRKKNEYEKAKICINEALKIDPQNKEAHKEIKLMKKLQSDSDFVKILSSYESTLFTKETYFSHRQTDENPYYKILSIDSRDTSCKLKIEETYFTRRQADENPYYKILSIDGGGIRGILPALWLSEIEKRTQRPISHLFNMAAGTSTGAIIAEGLSVPLDNSGVPSSYYPRYKACDLLQFYTNELPNIFTTGWDFFPFSLMMKTKYTNIGRLTMFQQKLDQVKLSNALMELVIPTANKSNLTHSHLFTRYDSRQDPADNATFVESLMATTAAPTFFPPYEISGKGVFVDGGIHLNNPAMIAYTEALSYRIQTDKIFVLSMGTGNYIPEPEHPDLYREQLFWAKNLDKIAPPAQEGTVDKYMYHELGNRYQRWQILMEEPIKLDACKKSDIDSLINTGQQYIEELYASDDNTMNNLLEFLEQDPIQPSAKNVFFQFKPNLNLQDLLTKYDTKDHSVALRRATSQGSTKDVEFLIKMTNVNDRDDNPDSRKTALHWAIMRKYYGIIILLINNGADVTIEDAQGKTPMDYAIGSEDPNILLILDKKRLSP